MAGKRRAPLSDEEKAERRRRDLERFEKATHELLTSEGWACWLSTPRPLPELQPAHLESDCR